MKKMQKLLQDEKNENDFIAAMKSAYPQAAAPDNLTAVAANLYK